MPGGLGSLMAVYAYGARVGRCGARWAGALPGEGPGPMATESDLCYVAPWRGWDIAAEPLWGFSVALRADQRAFIRLSWGLFRAALSYFRTLARFRLAPPRGARDRGAARGHVRCARGEWRSRGHGVLGGRSLVRRGGSARRDWLRHGAHG